MANTMNNATVNTVVAKENGMKNFIDCLVAELKDRFDGEVVTQEVLKNNRMRNGITLRNVGQVVAPTIYVEEFFESYNAGEMDIPEIADKIIDITEKNQMPLEQKLDEFTNWEYAKDRVMPVLLSKDTNEELLKSLVYTDTKTDIAECYVVVLSENSEQGRMSVKVTKELFKNYGIKKTELKSAARKNALQSMEFKSMAETLREMMGDMADIMGIPEEENGMWVLSNKSKTNGAGVLFVPPVLKKVAKRTGKESFFILPSSIHEVLVVTEDGVDKDTLKGMVVDVNATQVAPEDKLTDSVYFYDGKKVSVVA
jgi:hypothetical protein